MTVTSESAAFVATFSGAAEGEVIAKWGVRDFPRNLADDLAADPVDLATHVAVKKRIQAQGFCLILGAVLILL